MHEPLNLQDPAVVAQQLTQEAEALTTLIEAQSVELQDVARALALLLECYAGQAKTAAQMIEARKRAAGRIIVPRVKVS